MQHRIDETIWVNCVDTRADSTDDNASCLAGRAARRSPIGDELWWIDGTVGEASDPRSRLIWRIRIISTRVFQGPMPSESASARNGRNAAHPRSQ
jgi:hypothetical protein